MKTINRNELISKVKEACYKINHYLNEDYLKQIEIQQQKETKILAKNVLNQIIENAKVAKSDNIPLCQDTGFLVIFVTIGKVSINFDLKETLNEAVKEAYTSAYLRKSIVAHPLQRNKTDHIPAVIHYEFNNDNKLTILIGAKGGGAENMSQMTFLKPNAGIDGVTNYIIKVIKEAGGKACPPFNIGIGIGGNFEQVTYYAKKALYRHEIAENEYDRNLEQHLLKAINTTNIGPMGYGGKITALKVNVITAPTHITSLPVAVNIDCHCTRFTKVEL